LNLSTGFVTSFCYWPIEVFCTQKPNQTQHTFSSHKINFGRVQFDNIAARYLPIFFWVFGLCLAHVIIFVSLSVTLWFFLPVLVLQNLYI